MCPAYQLLKTFLFAAQNAEVSKCFPHNTISFTSCGCFGLLKESANSIKSFSRAHGWFPIACTQGKWNPALTKQLFSNKIIPLQQMQRAHNKDLLICSKTITPLLVKINIQFCSFQRAFSNSPRKDETAWLIWNLSKIQSLLIDRCHRSVRTVWLC